MIKVRMPPKNSAAQLNRRSAQQSGIFMALALLIVAFAILNKAFLSLDNFINIGQQATLLAISAFAMTFVILIGEIDLSIGATASLVGVIIASLVHGGMAWPLAVLGGLAVGTLVGFANGIIIVHGKIASFIVTLGTFNIVGGAALAISQGTTIVFDAPLYRTLFARGNVLSIPSPVILATLLFVVLQWLLTQTRFGAHSYAVGGQESSARMAGIAVGRIKVGVFTLSGFLMAIAALVLTARVGNAEPTSGIGLEFDAIGAVVIGGTSFEGGRGSLIRTIWGVLLIGVLNNGLTLMGVNYYSQLIIKGAIIVLAVLIDRWAR